MTKRVLTVRCSHCKRLDTVSATLEEARQMRCGLCHQKMIVTGHTGHHEVPSLFGSNDPSPVYAAPGIETAFWKLTPEQTETARGLVLSAFEEV